MNPYQLKARLSFVFLGILFVALSYMQGNFFYVFLTLIALLIHEFTHMLSCELLGYPVQELALTPLGGSLKVDPSFVMNPYAELIIALAGPLANLLMVGGVIYLGLLGIENYFLKEWLEINWFIGTVNLIPAQPLDGGRIFHALLNKNLGRNISHRIVKITTLVIALLIFIFGLSRLIRSQSGILYILIGTFLFFQLLYFKIPSFNLIVKTLQQKKKRLASKGFIRIRPILVEPDSLVRVPLQFYGANDYLLFFSLDPKLKMKVISEETALNSLLNQGYDVTFTMITKEAQTNRYCRIHSDEIE